MVDFIDRKKSLSRYFPKPFYNLKEGQGLSIVLETVGDELNDLDTRIKNYREQFLLATALENYLTVHGVQLDVFKPLGTKMRDASYRELIRVVTNSPKNIEYIFERVIKIFFGNDVFINGLADIYSYRNHEIVFKLNKNALVIATIRDLLGTTYLHRSPLNAFDGDSLDLWTTSLSSPAASGATSVTLSSIPVGIPTAGIIQLGDTSSAENKLFNRSGNVLTFLSPIEGSYAAGFDVQGPKFPDDYPSAYMYDSPVECDLVGSVLAGVTSITLGGDFAKLPLSGTVLIGNDLAANIEAKGFSRSGNVLTLDGPVASNHSSGEKVAKSILIRSIRTTLSAPIAQGTSSATLAVVNGADFPLRKGVLRLSWSFSNQEDIPFIGRVVGNNTILDIDPAYVFRKSHSSGASVHLMAEQTKLTKTGESYPFYLNDTAKIRDQFLALLSRLKVTGVRLKVELV